jgi:uncharacterized protein (DUF58 family)
MAQEPQTLSSRPVPLMGFLCIMAGCGMMYSARKFGSTAGEWSSFVQGGGGIIGLILVLWGIRLVALRFAPRVGKSVGRLNRNRVMLPREGMMYLLIMIVAFIGSLIGRSNMLMLVFSIMAGPFILNGWITFTLLKRNRLIRILPRRAMAGDVISVEITLRNRKFWFSSWLMVVRDRLSRTVNGKSDQSSVLEPAVLFASVRPRQERTACYQLRLTERGKYEFGPMEMSTRFPLGLVERGYVTDVRGELLVHPRIGRLGQRWYNEARMASESVQRQHTQRGMFEDEFHHLRDYRSGDNPRDIHWRTSARVQGLMVRKYEQSRDQGLIVLLDLWQAKQPDSEQEDRVELAISFAATIGVDHLKQTRGVQHYLFVSGREFQTWKADTGTGASEGLLDVLAVAEAGCESKMESLIPVASQVATSMMRVVLITTRLPEDVPNFENETMPGLELIHADRDELARWFSVDGANTALDGKTSQPVSNQDARDGKTTQPVSNQDARDGETTPPAQEGVPV